MKAFIIISISITTLLAAVSYKHSKETVVTTVSHAAACNSPFASIADNYSLACK